MRRIAGVFAATVGLALPAAAEAAVTPTRDGGALAGAMTSPSTSGAVVGATLQAPPSGTPDAISSTALGGFPLFGTTYAILTSGDATLAPSESQDDFAGVADDGDATVERGNAE